MTPPHDHQHDEHKKGTHHHHDLKGRNLGITILLNVFITVAQIIGSVFSGSLALLSDALHNFSDVIALIISWIAIRLGKLPANDKKTFGYKRAEILAALINAVTLLFIAFFLIKEAISRFGTPIDINATTVIILAGLSIVLNGLSVLLVAKDAKGNMNMRSAYLHLFSDMISSVAVMLGGVFMAIWKISWIDNVLSIVIAIYLIIYSWKLVMDTLKILMQFTPAGIQIKKVCKTITSYCEIANVHHVHIWQLNDQQIHFEAHVDFKSNLSLEDVDMVLGKIRHQLKSEYNITHCTLQPEFHVDDNKEMIIQ